MEIEKFHVPNIGVISRLQRALGVIQPNEASCSSESSLSWLQMGQLGDDEKLWEGGPKLCLCIWLYFLWDWKTPAIQFYIKINIQPFQKEESAGGRGLCQTLRKKTQIKNQSWYTIFNQVWKVYCRGTFQSVLSMLVFFWAINFEVNWRSSSCKDSWGHWQYVWFIMTHKSTLTLVIAGFWLVGNSAGELEKKRCPSPPFLSSFFSPSGRPSFSLHFLYPSPS